MVEKKYIFKYLHLFVGTATWLFAVAISLQMRFVNIEMKILIKNIFTLSAAALTIYYFINKSLKKEWVDHNQIYFRDHFLALVGIFLCALVWMTYFIIFYPGFISWDFYVQWHEMSGRIPLTDWHPVFHTLAILLLTKIWNSPAIISLVQIAAMSFLVGVLVFTIIFYAFFPLNGFYAVSLWKDIGYSISFLWFILVLLSIYSSEGKDLLKTGILIQLFVSLLFVSLMRHNGIIPAFGTLLILYLLHSRHYFYRIFLVTIFLFYL